MENKAISLEFYQLTREELVKRIKEARNTIRLHRDEVGDFRCWVDDYKVWSMVSGLPAFPEFDYNKFMDRCENFFNHRRSETADPVPEDAVIKRHSWDTDLKDLPTKTLRGELLKIWWAISDHATNPEKESRPRTLDDDRKLYRILPEKLPADFRLPSRGSFLGKDLYPNAGCPAFWDSHTSCRGQHNFLVWGPCK